MNLEATLTMARLSEWKKILVFWQENIASPRLTANDEKKSDTLRATMVKFLCAIQGIEATPYL